jgi:hypothetical protein
MGGTEWKFSRAQAMEKDKQKAMQKGDGKAGPSRL